MNGNPEYSEELEELITEVEDIAENLPEEDIDDIVEVVEDIIDAAFQLGYESALEDLKGDSENE